jgi:hypothetical protein
MYVVYRACMARDFLAHSYMHSSDHFRLSTAVPQSITLIRISHALGTAATPIDADTFL